MIPDSVELLARIKKLEEDLTYAYADSREHLIERVRKLRKERSEISKCETIEQVREILKRREP